MIILLVLLAAFGPVLWLVPSKRDRRLSALRDQARREGLTVSLTSVPKLAAAAEERVTAGGRVRQPQIECAAYTRPLRRRLGELPRWRLLRGQGDSQVVPGWEFDPQRVARGAEFEATLVTLQDLLSNLPADVVGLELGERELSVYWLESPGNDRSSVAALAAMLAASHDRLLDLDRKYQRLAEDEDS